MSETKVAKRPYRVTVTREATVWVLAESKGQAEAWAEDNESDVLAYADVHAYASEETNKLHEDLENDDRTVAEFLSGDPPKADQDAAAHAAWMSKRPSGSAAEHAAWLATRPETWFEGVSADGEHVWCRYSALRVDGAALPKSGAMLIGNIVKATVDIRAGATKPVTRGGSGSFGEVAGADAGKQIAYHWWGPAAIDDARAAEWLPGEPRAAFAGGALDAVFFIGDGWEAAIMPLAV